MHLTPTYLPVLATRLMAERKRQGLSRSQAAAVCNVSPSFIRDAESTPERCTMGKLLLNGGCKLASSALPLTSPAW